MSSNEVKVRLMGGLGNQLFQYAMGRTLADKLNAELVLDPQYVVRKGFVSGLAIDLFNVRARVDAKQAKLFPEWKWKLSRALRHKLRPLFGFYHECQYTFEQIADKVALDSMLSGFWQSYKYIDNNSMLRADLTTSVALTVEQLAIAEKMAQCESVAVHVRRGDYLHNPKALAKHGICSSAYYQAAVLAMKEQLAAPVFFVFSDDPKWVKEHIGIENAVFVSDHGFAQEVDLTLISKCQHQIIANSSFSWWGAYLNVNPNKYVITPTPWFDADISDEDLIPPSWIRMAK